MIRQTSSNYLHGSCMMYQLIKVSKLQQKIKLVPLPHVPYPLTTSWLFFTKLTVLKLLEAKNQCITKNGP